MFSGTLAALAVCLLASPTEANVAKFRVTGAKMIGADRAELTIHWDYQSGGSSSYTGKGVKFRIFNKEPGRWHDRGAGPGLEVRQTVDMHNGSGTATLTVPLPKGAKPGANLVLTGEWTSGHRWGTDSTRKGGKFQLPGSITPNLLNVNKATAAELTQLKGVGAALAQRIVTLRDQQPRKRFKSVDGLTAVKGISTRSLAPLKSMLVTKDPPKPKRPPSVNINTATETQLLALPGIGAKRAKAIVDHRTKMQQSPYKYQRRFNGVSELVRVPGITRGVVNKIEPLLKVKGRTTGLPRVKKGSTRAQANSALGLRSYRRGRWQGVRFAPRRR